MKYLIFVASQFFFFNSSHAYSSYCQDYMENGIFSPIFYPDLWTMDTNSKFKKNDSFSNTEEFKQQGTIEEKTDKIILSKKFIPTVPTTRTEIELDATGKITKISSYQVANDSPNDPALFSSYEFRYANNKCYPYEEWDENSGTIYNTDFCNEVKPILQTHYKKRKQKKNQKNLAAQDEDKKEEKNLPLADLLSELMVKHKIRYKDGKPYLENLEARAKKQSNDPGLIIIEKTLMINKVCKEMDGVSRALKDTSLFNQSIIKKEILETTNDHSKNQINAKARSPSTTN